MANFMKTKTLIIAEIGVNHNGSVNLAKEMIHASVNAGVDFVKFQTFNADMLVTKLAPQAGYQLKQDSLCDSNGTQYEMLKKLELSREDHLELMDCANSLGVGFLSTAFDFSSLDLLIDLGLKTFKVPSGEINNLPYLRRVAVCADKIILSTGMATLGEIESALSIFFAAGVSAKDITVLHCTTDYPTSMSDVNLRAMQTLEKSFGVEVGYSDHTLGIEVPIAAVALGARVIEKHFTLSRKMTGPDHAASIEPDEMRQMVSAIRNIEQALGSAIKTPTEGELANRKFARKSIVAIKAITKGEFFSAENLGLKRPGNGLTPMMWDEIIGKRASRDFQKDDLIEL